jgi:hypothetical protein
MDEDRRRAREGEKNIGCDREGRILREIGMHPDGPCEPRIPAVTYSHPRVAAQLDDEESQARSHQNEERRVNHSRAEWRIQGHIASFRGRLISLRQAQLDEADDFLAISTS